MKKTNFSDIIIFIKGMFMGMADVVPGVSGGTIAIITGIYEELLRTINGINLKIYNDYKKLGIKNVWINYNLSFLFKVISGIFFSITIFSQFILLLIENFPIALWSLFLGLITASIIFLLRQTDKLDFKKSRFILPNQIYLLLIGIFLAIYIQMIKPSSTDIDFIYLLFCGMISITAMLLPGISGAYILVLLGAYETMLLTFKEVIKFNSDYFLNFFSFAFGAILGVKLFSKFLTWSYTKYKNNTLYCLIGFMIGSLPSLWPWKYKNVSTSNFIQNMYIPQNYFQNSEFNQGILFFVIGVMVVLILERFSHERKK
jgi:putative membrane protein